MKIKLFGIKMPITGIFVFLILGIIIGSTMCVCRVEPMALIGHRMGKDVENSYDDPERQTETPPYETYDGPVQPCAAKSKDFYAENTFDPKCCNYSNISSQGGCVCVTKEQINCLSSRGGNNL